MARYRWTLALIIICLPILATVITAFRVRDLPKNLQDSLRLDLKKQKCDDCDVSDAKDKLHSVKIESATKKYEELKKAVREKQQELHQKAPDKPIYKVIDDSADDDDDDDDSAFLKNENILKKEHSNIAKSKKDGIESKRNIPTKKSTGVDDNNDEDDEVSSNGKLKAADLKKKSDLNKKKGAAKLQNKKVLPKKVTVDNDDLSDDDEDDDNDNDDSKLKSHVKKDIVSSEIKKSKEPKTKEQPNVRKLKSDDKEKKTKVSESIVKSGEKQRQKESKKPVKQSQRHDDSNDSDDDDDDDEDNEDKEKKTINVIKSKTILEDQHKAKDSVKHSKPKLIQIDVDDDDDDDDDDDNDNDDSGFFGSLKNFAKQITGSNDDEQSLPEKSSKQGQKDDKKDKLAKSDNKDKTESKAKKSEDKKDSTKHESAQKDEKSNAKVDTEKKPVDKTKSPKEDKKDDIKKPKEPPVKDIKPKEQKDTKHKEETKPKVDSKEKVDKSKTEVKKDSKKMKKSSSEEILLDSNEIYAYDQKEGKMLHVTDALRRRNLLQSEFEDFYAFFPTFAPNFSRIHNPECRRHGQILLRQLRGTKLWALHMLDATAKIPSGILQGNTIQLGDFDQCLSSRAKVQLETGTVVKVQGQYCLARLEVKAENPELELPVHLALAKNLINSKIDDPGHFVPRFSTLSWGVCVPAVCDPQDVEVVIKDTIKHYQHRSGFIVKVKVDDDDCHTHEADWWDDWLELPTILTLSFYGVIVLLVLIATIQDFLARRTSGGEESQAEGEEQAEGNQEAKDGEDKEEKEAESKPSDGFLSSFSLYRTVGKLFASGTEDDIACVHGVRGLATIALLVAHKFQPVAMMPYTNRLKITELASSPLWSWARQGWMFTDCFLLLSGALTAHRISSDSSAAWRLFTKYLRLTPALLAVVLFYAYVWDLISVGPMWGTLVTKNAEVCQEGWWWNLFYIQNYFGFEEMCAPQTHQLALDMQLTIVGGILVWALQIDHVATRFLLPTLHLIAAYSRYTTVKDHRLTLIAYHGVTVSQLYRTARLSYTSILHRSTPYLVGLSLGLALRKPSEHGKLVFAVGWLTSIALWCSVWWAGYDSGYTTYRYSSTFAAQYTAFAPIASALAIAWIIYAVHNSDGSGVLSRLLRSWPLLLVSRLSYALYLCQFIVFLTTAATVRTSAEFTLASLVDVQEISAIILSSTLLTLTFIIPMQSLPKLFSFSSKVDSQEENKEEGDKEQEGVVEMPEDEKNFEQNHVEEVIEAPQGRSRGSFLAHREVLEEIPEVEVEYETQREKADGLEEILEEEEDGEEMPNHIDDDDLEIIEEEGEGDDVDEGGEDYWEERGEEYTPRRSNVREEDADEWEWTTSGGRGAQYFRYSR